MASIVVISGASRGNHLLLKPHTMVIGRDERCDLQVLDPKVSRRHMQVVPEGTAEHFLVEDTSSNGIVLNGKPVVTSVRLRDNDVIAIGESKLAFTLKIIDDREGALSFAAHGERLKQTLDS